MFYGEHRCRRNSGGINMGLYIENYFDETTFSKGRVPGRIIMALPVWDSAENKSAGWTLIAGLLRSEISISGSNKWGPVISDLTNLSDAVQFMGWQQIYSWVGASTQCWKSTDPISLNLEFTMVNYKPGLNLEDKLKQLMKLVSLSPYFGKTINDSAAVVPHQGYKARIIENNKNKFLFSNPKEITYFDDYTRETTMLSIQNLLGSRYTISNLIVHRCTFIPSVEEVTTGNAEDEVLPLYYNVSVTLSGTRALLSTDVENIFAQYT